MVNPCGDRKSMCVCSLPSGHEGPHECGAPVRNLDVPCCLGSWNDDGSVVRYPGGETNEADALKALEKLS